METDMQPASTMAPPLDALTITDLRAHCLAMAARIGPDASVSISIGCFGEPYLFVMPKVAARISKTFYGSDWASLFAQGEAWVAALPDPDAEWRSWQVAT